MNKNENQSFIEIDVAQILRKTSAIGFKLKAVATLFSEATRNGSNANFYDGMSYLLNDLGDDLIDLEDNPLTRSSQSSR